MIFAYYILNGAISANKFPWELVIAILGALAWAPWVFDQIKRSKVYGNVISYVTNLGTFNGRPGIIYFFKLSISCINKNFLIKSIDILIKYPNDPKWYAGEIFWARVSRWIIPDDQHKSLKLPTDNFLAFVNVFEKDKSGFYYLTFLVNKDRLEQFDRIILKFKNYKGRIRKIDISATNLNSDRLLFDDELWQ